MKDRHEKYLEPDKDVEKMGKENKKDTVENLAVEAEEAVLTTLRGGYSSENRPVKDENGRVLSRVQGNLKRLHEQFHSILN